MKKTLVVSVLMSLSLTAYASAEASGVSSDVVAAFDAIVESAKNIKVQVTQNATSDKGVCATIATITVDIQKMQDNKSALENGKYNMQNFIQTINSINTVKVDLEKGCFELLRKTTEDAGKGVENLGQKIENSKTMEYLRQQVDAVIEAGSKAIQQIKN